MADFLLGTSLKTHWVEIVKFDQIAANIVSSLADSQTNLSHLRQHNLERKN